jgi:hypothetical protein
MPARQQPSVRNRLLAAFSAEDFALLEPHLDTVTLPRDRVLYECHDIIRHKHRWPGTSKQGG